MDPGSTAAVLAQWSTVSRAKALRSYGPPRVATWPAKLNGRSFARISIYENGGMDVLVTSHTHVLTLTCYAVHTNVTVSRTLTLLFA